MILVRDPVSEEVQLPDLLQRQFLPLVRREADLLQGVAVHLVLHHLRLVAEDQGGDVFHRLVEEAVLLNAADRVGADPLNLFVRQVDVKVLLTHGHAGQADHVFLGAQLIAQEQAVRRGADRRQLAVAHERGVVRVVEAAGVQGDPVALLHLGVLPQADLRKRGMCKVELIRLDEDLTVLIAAVGRDGDHVRHEHHVHEVRDPVGILPVAQVAGDAEIAHPVRGAVLAQFALIHHDDPADLQRPGAGEDADRVVRLDGHVVAPHAGPEQAVVQVDAVHVGCRDVRQALLQTHIVEGLEGRGQVVVNDVLVRLRAAPHIAQAVRLFQFHLEEVARRPGACLRAHPVDRPHADPALLHGSRQQGVDEHLPKLGGLCFRRGGGVDAEGFREGIARVPFAAELLRQGGQVLRGVSGAESGVAQQGSVNGLRVGAELVRGTVGLQHGNGGVSRTGLAQGAAEGAALALPAPQSLRDGVSVLLVLRDQVRGIGLLPLQGEGRPTFKLVEVPHRDQGPGLLLRQVIGRHKNRKIEGHVLVGDIVDDHAVGQIPCGNEARVEGHVPVDAVVLGPARLKGRVVVPADEDKAEALGLLDRGDRRTRRKHHRLREEDIFQFLGRQVPHLVRQGKAHLVVDGALLVAALLRLFIGRGRRIGGPCRVFGAFREDLQRQHAHQENQREQQAQEAVHRACLHKS